MRSDFLRTVPLFSTLTDSELGSLAPAFSLRTYRKNQVIFLEQETGNYMYLVLAGKVKVTKSTSDGRESILAIHRAGDFFGEMSLLDSAPRSASVKTMTAARVLALSRNDFLSLLRRSPDLAMAVVQELTRRLRQVDEQASSLSFQRVKERTQGVLVRLAREDPGQLGQRATPPLTHQQIADMIGTSRETVTRVVKGLKQDGWLRQEGKRYVIPPDA